jgi:hypothetical protein
LSPSDPMVNAWIFLLVGLALAFAGRALIILQIGIAGALLGALGASALLTAALAQGVALPPEVPVTWAQVGALLIGAAIGWVLAGMLRRVAVFLLGALVGAGALAQLATLWPDLIPGAAAWVLGAILGGVLLLALEGPLLKVGTAVLGGLLVTSALTALLTPDQAGLASLAGLGVAVAGAITQLTRR